MSIKIIHNPYSARWKSDTFHQPIIDTFTKLGAEIDIEKSDYKGHGVELAKNAAEAGFKTIVAAGGDGTIGDVLNGIYQAKMGGITPKLGVIPLGTANDLAHNIDIPLNLTEACKSILAENTKSIDIGKFNDRYFINNSGLGLEPFVTIQQEKIKLFSGLLRYLIATLKAIAINPQWTMNLVWDDGEYHGPVSLISVNNCPLTGGLFYTAPDASPYDGKLTFSYGYVPTRLKILALLPRLMQTGEKSYIHHPAVHQIHSTTLKVTIEQSSPAHGDGELFAEYLSTADFSIIPQAIDIILPK